MLLPRLTRLVRQRPRLALVPLALAAAAGASLWLLTPSVNPWVNAAADPGLLVGRVWFDQLPDKPTDNFGRWAFLDGGFGFRGEGSAFRFNVDIVEFERQSDKLKVTFLQDERVVSTRFKVERCSDKPPFDACLIFEQSPGGPKKLYSFIDEDEEQARAPGAAAWRRSLPAQAAAAKPAKLNRVHLGRWSARWAALGGRAVGRPPPTPPSLRSGGDHRRTSASVGRVAGRCRTALAERRTPDAVGDLLAARPTDAEVRRWSPPERSEGGVGGGLPTARPPSAAHRALHLPRWTRFSPETAFARGARGGRASRGAPSRG